MSKYGDDPLAPLPSGHSSTIMSDEFSNNSPEKTAREARIARSSHAAAEGESFPDEPKEETRRKKTRSNNKHRGETPPRSPRSSEQPMSNNSSGSGHRKKRASSRPRSNNSTAATKGRRPRSAGESSSNKRPPSPATSNRPRSPRPPPAPRPPSMTSPDDTKENRNINHETTTDVIDNNVEVVAAAPRGRLSKRPSSGLANQVSSRASPIYQITSRRYSNRSIPSDDDDGIVKIEAVPSHVAKGVVSFTTASSTADEELGTASGSIRYSSRDLSAGTKYPSVWTRLPNTSFGISMGLAGQAIMWKIASNVDFLSTMLDTQLLNTGFWIASLTIGVLLFTAYMLKAWFYFPLVRDEYNDGSRIHFLNMPHLVMLMLTIAVPEGTGTSMNMMGESHTGEQIIFGLGFAIQLFFTQHVYQSWLFSDTHNISCARPQFLLSTVGWFFLATLGAQAQIEQEWGLALPSWCFGFGIMLYLMVAISIFNGIHAAPKAKGSPALFLLIAPPSVGVVAWDLINNGGPGNFSDMSELLLGWCLGVFMLLIKLGPRILQAPPSLGSYWAYVFPMSALASALIRYAWAVGSRASEILAIVFVSLSMFALLAVFIRMTTHIYRVWAGLAVWGDPLLSPERLASVSAITYSELIPAVETA